MENINSGVLSNNENTINDSVKLIPGTEINLPDPLLEELPKIPDRIGDSFPAVVHEFLRAKGKIYDEGWKIKWFDDEELAKDARDLSRRESEGIYITKYFFENLESKENRDFSEIIFSKISLADKDDILKLANIGDYSFVPKNVFKKYIEGYESNDGYISSPGYYQDAFEEYTRRQDGELVISLSSQFNVFYDLRHYYDIAIKNGAIKEELDIKLINNFNENLENLNKEFLNIETQIKKQSLREVCDSLPSLYFKNKSLEYQLEKFYSLYHVLHQSVEEYKIDTIEEYFNFSVGMGKLNSQLDIDLFNCVEYLNKEIVKLNEFWKGAYKETLERELNGEILLNYGGHFRKMGGSGNADYWVIRPNGDIRPPIHIEFRKEYFDEGEKKWDVVLPEEIALSWHKSSTNSEHIFEVDKTSTVLTEDQLQSVKKIQESIKENWDYRSNSKVGEGWMSILDENVIIDDIDDFGKDDIEQEESLEQKLKALKDKFNNK